MRSFFLLVLFSISPAVSADTVAIIGADEGKGYSWLAGQDCFVVIPEHVVRFQQSVNVIARNGSRSTAERFTNLGIAEVDIALLKAENPDICRNEQLDLAFDLADRLSDAETGTLESSDELSGLRRIRVYIDNIDNREVIVRPYYPQDTITKGLSGSTLKIDGQVAGMLVSVRDGKGVVYRQNFIASLVSGTIDASAAEQAYQNLAAWTTQSDSPIPEIRKRWQDLTGRYPFHVQTAEQARRWEEAFIDKRNMCVANLQCETRVMSSIRICREAIEDSNVNERTKMDGIRNCFRQTGDIRACYNVNSRSQLNAERRQCEFAKSYTEFQEPDLTPYQAAEVVDGNVSWNPRGNNKFRATYEYAFRNNNQEKTIRCRFRVSGVTLRRSDRSLGKTSDSKSHNIRIRAGEEVEVSGWVDVKLTSPQYMPSVYRFRTCRYQ